MTAKELFLPDGSDWHLSGCDMEQANVRCDTIIKLYQSIPESDFLYLQQNDRLENSEIEFLGRGGKSWIIEPLRFLQPLSFAVLQEFASEYMVGFCWYGQFGLPKKDVMNTTGFFEIKKRVVNVSFPIEGTYEDGKYLNELAALPDELSHSWLWRCSNWCIADDPLGSVMTNRQLIGHPNGGWEPFDNILAEFDRQWKKKLLPLVLNKIPNAYITHYNPYNGKPYQWASLRCFLDTRPFGLSGKCGDQFFVLDTSYDKIVYHIHDGDVANLRILNNPAQAIDEYCAHTLLRTEGRFDFLPWSNVI